MKIQYFGYNAFLIAAADKTLAIDPGCSFYLPTFLRPLIPRQAWPGITHLFVTHGDPDHHWHTERVAKTSQAAVICNHAMVKDSGRRRLMLSSRSTRLHFAAKIARLCTLGVGDELLLDGVGVTGFAGQHGPMEIGLGPLKKTLRLGPGQRFAWGQMGFKIEVEGKSIANFGDTLLLDDAWDAIQSVDLAMIPIGGRITMDLDQALQAIVMLKPKTVIPCHYNQPLFFTKASKHTIPPEPLERFKEEAERLGTACVLLRPGEEYTL